MLDEVTSSIVGFQNKGDESFDVLKKGLAYCWSVAVAPCPENGEEADGEVDMEPRQEHCLDCEGEPQEEQIS